jgi:hypothetical protein
MGRKPLDPSTLKNDGREAWHRQPGEPALHYRRFLAFLEEGLGGNRRRLAQVVETLKTLDSAHPVTVRTLQQTSYEYQWATRAEEWDADQFEHELERLRKQRQEALERQRKLGLALQVKATQRLQNIPLGDLSGNEVVRMAVEGSRLELSALGEPDRRVEVSGPRGGPIQTEALDQLSPAQRRERMAEVQEQIARRLGVQTDTTDPDDQVS